jgi:hypothetical protein
VAVFSVLIAPPGSPFVLASDAGLVAAFEKDASLAQSLAAAAPFTYGRQRVFVTGSTAYSGGRILYQCVAVPDNAPISDLSKT